jgi:hypothetical protein
LSKPYNGLQVEEYVTETLEAAVDELREAQS